MEEKLKVEGMLFEISNGNAVDCKYNIRANVKVLGGKANNVENGQVTEKDTGMIRASFSDYGSGLSLNYNGEEMMLKDKIEILTAVHECYAMAKEGRFDMDQSIK